MKGLTFENQCNYHNETERENHTAISTDTEKAFDVVQYPFTIKILRN